MQRNSNFVYLERSLKMICKKCNSAPGTIVLRKKDNYCKECFLVNTNHKFRACIGKNKILSRNEHVLVCVSGGKASTVLLDLIYSGLGQDIHKKLRILPIVLHIIEDSDDNGEIVNKVKSKCSTYNMDVYIIHISEYVNLNMVLPDPFIEPDKNPEASLKFKQLTTSQQTTALNDFILKIKRSLFIRVAKLLGCNYIFTAETTTTLAVNLLSNIAVGRGSQVENDVGFCDSRTKSIKLLRPMKDITNEELDYYVKINKICTHPIQNKLHDKSIHSLIQSFVTDLQLNFPATISTVCKTAEKIGYHEKKESTNNCTICESDLDPHGQKLTALQATVFSKLVSHENSQVSSKNMIKFSDNVFIPSCIDDTSPLTNKTLCYTCNTIFLEMKT